MANKVLAWGSGRRDFEYEAGAKAIPCFAGKIQGKFAWEREIAPVGPPEHGGNPEDFTKIPYVAEQGISSLDQGIRTREQGSVSAAARGDIKCVQSPHSADKRTLQCTPRMSVHGQ